MDGRRSTTKMLFPVLYPSQSPKAYSAVFATAAGLSLLLDAGAACYTSKAGSHGDFSEVGTQTGARLPVGSSIAARPARGGPHG